MDAHRRPPKLMDRVKAIMKVKRYSPRTEKTYCYWSQGTDIRTVQELRGHKSVETTQIYTHVLGKGFAGVRSPLG